MSAALKSMMAFALVIIVITSTCVWLDWFVGSPWPLSVALVTTAILSFMSCIFMSEMHGRTWISEPSDIRATIAVSLIIEYAVLVGLVVPFTGGAERLPAITQTVITSFSSILGVIIAFFFGTSAYVQAQERRGQQQPTDTTEHKS
jgi:hypothetical protein